MAFRFIHTADIHLDSPLRSLALRNPGLAELVGDASRQTFIAVVDLCLAEQVDALVIAGDLYDGDQTSMKTARFLAAQMMRLHQAGIRVYVIRGNHDAMSRITKQLVLPDTVTIFGGRCQSVVQHGSGVDVTFHGLSFASPKAPDSLLPKYAGPQEGVANIGIMHTSLAGSPGHDVYAPCSVADLHGHGFDYWALGHIHVRQVHSGASTLVMPGIPQGRDINEAGEKSVTLVTIRDDRSVEIEERLTSVAQFERVSVDLTGAAEWGEAVIRIRAGLEQAREEARSRYLVARLGLVGTSPLSWSLMRDRDLAVAEAEQAAEQVGDTWVEKLELDLSAPAVADTDNVADPTLELAQSMRANAGSEAFRAEARDFILKMIADLPPDARGFAGRDEAGLDRFLDDVLAGSVDLVTARLKSGPTR
ncbi:DNA repair exonuclease [Mesorhizobium sp.]|uniref:metallophosphoesterase family protein n=1 Tax=Mesorhizobium sp. TaxID=1871066 RepID=UPI000FE87477|nr:DNA repair exonuclease [Mesorhizobium sp.]RWI16733.1 MAG: DNA repair exonuclease [Mesorhizobium sp.]RWN08779.1 MAG: DNA repair exonuclease [Mesorhizobium sp.]RWN16204.1 MAG: DNA repair exonuclease [Mesorhizobium sp.]TIQ97495.1 MAG: DNA repair exonuclease [Mesorhizobium sp.]